jgi:integrase
MGKLTDRTVKTAKAGYHGDGNGLYLQVTPAGARTWLFRYKVAGKNTWMGLGPVRLVSLANARDAALEAKKQLRAGIDPLTHKRAARSVQQKNNIHPFEAVAAEYIEAHKAGWKNAKHGDQWTATLMAYAYPVIGALDVATIKLDHILQILKPIWIVKSETASRVRGRIESVLDYAAVHGWRSRENPARWRGYLSEVLPAKAKVAKVEHHAALPWKEAPMLWAELRRHGAVSARCLQFVILTATRSGEARGARWNEVDLTEKLWTIPEGRMKGGKAHRVPLNAAAMLVLEEMNPLKRKPNDLVFPGGSKTNPLSDVAVSKALHTLRDGLTVHGFRSTFRDWCAEGIGCAREVAEAALAHTNKNKVEAAYARTDHLERRQELMAAWGRYLEPVAVDIVEQPPCE